MIQTDKWHLIASEHRLIRSYLNSGMEDLSYAGVKDPARYVVGLFSIGIAIERSCKLAILIDSRVSGGSPPDIKKLKHDIVKLYGLCGELSLKNGFGISFPDLGDSEYSDIIDVTSRICSGGSRYYGIDILSGRQASDPLRDIRKIADSLFQKDVNKSSIQREIRQGQAVSDATSSISYIIDYDIDGTHLGSLAEVMRRSIVYRESSRRMKMSIIKILKPIVIMFSKYDYRSIDIPVSQDFYAVLNNTPNYISSLKTLRNK